MGIFDKITKLAEKATESLINTSDRINQTYQKDGFDGILNKTSDSLQQVGKVTKNYINTIGEKNQEIMRSIPEKDWESKIAKAAAVVINTTETIVSDTAQLTKNTLESVSKNLSTDDLVKNEKNFSTQSNVDKSNIGKVKELFLNDAQIAELDCMPIELYVKTLASKEFDSLEKDNGLSNEYCIIDNFLVKIKGQDWTNIKNGKNGTGSISFMKEYFLSQSNLSEHESSDLQGEVTKGTLRTLTAISQSKQYQQDLTDWIIEQKSQTQEKVLKEPIKKAAVKKTVKKSPVQEVEGKVVKPKKATTKTSMQDFDDNVVLEKRKTKSTKVAKALDSKEPIAELKAPTKAKKLTPKR